MKNKILEYYEGNPDRVYDSETETSIHWSDDDSVSFGFFPVDLNDSYEFMTGSSTHLNISEHACDKLVGKAKHHISESYYDFLRDQCYDKSYCLGRYWKDRNIIAFWYYGPTNDIFKQIIKKLNIEPETCIMVDKENNEEGTTITVSDFMRNGGGNENGSQEKMTPFRIDPKIRDIIEKYNETEKSWQVQKEKSGWDTIARRNAMIYQENKVLKEYVDGDPDTVDEYDEETGEWVKSYRYNSSKCISFAFFETAPDKKEFVMSDEKGHSDISRDCAVKYVGKAMPHLTESEFLNVSYKIYHTAAYKGRIFLEPKVVTFWRRTSPDKVEQILNMLGGIEKFRDFMFIIPYQWDADNPKKQDREVPLEWYIAGEYPEYSENHSDNEEHMEERVMGLLPPELREKITKYNSVNTNSWAANKEREGWDTIAQRNAMLYQEGKNKKKAINEYYTGDPDTVRKFDDETCELIDSTNFRDPNVLSFGFFQTSLGGGKEFIYSVDKSHSDISMECAEKYIGKAMGHGDIGRDDVRAIKNYIYSNAAYTGRVFLDYRVITTWHTLSSDKLREIMELLGGVEQFKGCKYLVDWDKEYDAIEYINSGVNGEDEYEAGKMKTPIEMFLSKWLVDTIKQYNAPSGWAAKKEGEGWKTLAQRNNTIYQENKTNMKTNKYEKEFSNYLQIMSEALSKKDFAVFDAAKEMLEETVDDCKKEQGLLKEMNTTNFGVLNHIFEEALPTLIKSNKRAVRNVIKTIKEDKNLMAEFNFYNIIDNYNSKISESVAPDVIFDKLSETILEKIDHKEIKKSNKKLRDVMCESGIIPLSHVSDEKMKLYESGNYMLSTAPSMSNVYKMYENKNNVIHYLDSHKNDVVTEAVKPEELINNFEKELKEKLTESEISFVQQITDFRSPIAEQRKEKLFNKFKNECIDKINDMLKEDSNNVELKGLSDQINEMKFNKETIVKDIAKLLEIRDILLDE